MKIDHIINAFNLGLKFYRGMFLLAQDRAQSEIATKLNSEKDGEHWVMKVPSLAKNLLSCFRTSRTVS